MDIIFIFIIHTTLHGQYFYKRHYNRDYSSLDLCLKSVLILNTINSTTPIQVANTSLALVGYKTLFSKQKIQLRVRLECKVQ